MLDSKGLTLKIGWHRGVNRNGDASEKYKHLNLLDYPI